MLVLELTDLPFASAVAKPLGLSASADMIAGEPGYALVEWVRGGSGTFAVPWPRTGKTPST